jgi:hypothetical protein
MELPIRQSTTSAPATPGATVPQAPAANPTEFYQAVVAARKELRNQLSRLENDRANLSRKLTSTNNPISGVDRTGIEKAITDVDAQIAGVRKDLAAADARVAQAAGVPGTLTEIPSSRNDQPPTGVIGATLLFLLALPVVIAFSRRIWRRADKPVAPSLPADVSARLDRLEQAVESVAIEMERVGEGQRFVTQLLAEGPARSLNAGGGAEPLKVAARDAAKESR